MGVDERFGRIFNVGWTKKITALATKPVNKAAWFDIIPQNKIWFCLKTVLLNFYLVTIVQLTAVLVYLWGTMGEVCQRALHRDVTSEPTFHIIVLLCIPTGVSCGTKTIDSFRIRDSTPRLKSIWQGLLVAISFESPEKFFNFFQSECMLRMVVKFMQSLLYS